MATQSGHQENLGHVIFITAAAAIGGFLFGYDSAVINGAVVGIQKYFRVGPVEIGIMVAIALLGSAIGALIAGRMADRIGPDPGHADRRRPVHGQRGRSALPVRAVGPGLLADRRRVRHRHGLGDRPGLHRRGRRRPPTAAGWLLPAGRDRRSASRSRSWSTTLILRRPAATSAASSWAWRPGSGCSASWSSRPSSTGCSSFDHPRVAPLPDRRRPDEQARAGAGRGRGRRRRPGRPRRRDRARHAAASTGRASRTCAARGSACCRSSGSASACRSSSSSSAST